MLPAGASASRRLTRPLFTGLASGSVAQMRRPVSGAGSSAANASSAQRVAGAQAQQLERQVEVGLAAVQRPVEAELLGRERGRRQAHTLPFQRSRLAVLASCTQIRASACRSSGRMTVVPLAATG